MAILINSKNQNKKIRIDLNKIENVARESLKQLKKINCELNIVFISSQKIRVLNRQYFKKDSATDVIAFPAGKDPVKRKTNDERRTTSFLGDIAISTDRAKRNAKIYKVTFKEEVALYAIHGILHLLGYEDTNKKKRDLMKKKENETFGNIKKFI